MFRSASFLTLGKCSRNVVGVATKPKQQVIKSQSVTTEEGFQLIAFPQQLLGNGLSRVSLVFKAGSRFETTKNQGITHLIRRSFGISTPDFTSFNLTRHFQQMGARVQCSSTREHIIYSVDVAPNLASRAGYLLATMATNPCYYEWELKDTVYKLMRKDVDILNRRNLSALTMELLHEAAFGQHPSGSGLGFSLFTAPDRVGIHSLDEIQLYHQNHFTPRHCALSISGVETDKDGLEILERIKSGIRVYPQTVDQVKNNVHGFVGGEIRRSLSAASTVYAFLAWPVVDHQNHLVYDLIKSYLNGSVDRVAYGGKLSQSPIARSNAEDSIVEAVAFHHSYSDHGLFGIGLGGVCSKAVAERVQRILSNLKSINMSAEDLKKSKCICKADYMMGLESPLNFATYLTVELSSNEQVNQHLTDQCTNIDKITLENVNNAIKTMFSSNQAAMALVGPNLGEIPPLSFLLKS